MAAQVADLRAILTFSGRMPQSLRVNLAAWISVLFVKS